MKLIVTLDRDETGMVVAECPAIPGCVSQGETEDEAMANIREAIELCVSCKDEHASDVLLRELLDNALRTAAQHRFEDAAARLYRAMEMQGQLWLAETTNAPSRTAD